MIGAGMDANPVINPKIPRHRPRYSIGTNSTCRGVSDTKPVINRNPVNKAEIIKKPVNQRSYRNDLPVSCLVFPHPKGFQDRFAPNMVLHSGKDIRYTLQLASVLDGSPLTINMDAVSHHPLLYLSFGG